MCVPITSKPYWSILWDLSEICHVIYIAVKSVEFPVNPLSWFYISILAICKHSSLCWFACTCIVATSKVVTVSSLQLSTVVLLPKLLQMVSEMSLVQPLDPQWPTPVTEGMPCKETADVPAWPMESGVGGHQFAVVSCFTIRCSTIDNTWALSPLERCCCSVKRVG